MHACLLVGAWVSVMKMQNGLGGGSTLIIVLFILFNSMLCRLKFALVCVRSALNAFVADSAFAVRIRCAYKGVTIEEKIKLQITEKK